MLFLSPAALEVEVAERNSNMGSDLNSKKSADLAYFLHLLLGDGRNYLALLQLPYSLSSATGF